MKKCLVSLILLGSFLWANWHPWTKDIDEDNQTSIVTVFLNENQDIEIGLLLSKDEEMGLVLIYKNINDPIFQSERLNVEYEVDENDSILLNTYIIDNQIIASNFFDNNFLSLLEQMEKGQNLKIILPNKKSVDIPLKGFAEVYKLLK